MYPTAQSPHQLAAYPTDHPTNRPTDRPTDWTPAQPLTMTPLIFPSGRRHDA
jgi:hypothetical protein